jgi:hypothetical protein
MPFSITFPDEIVYALVILSEHLVIGCDVWVTEEEKSSQRAANLQ